MDIPTIEDFNRLEKQIEELTTLVKHLSLNQTMKQVVTIADICKMEGLSKSYLMYHCKWLMPNFGVSQYEGVTRWDTEIYLKWKTMPVEQRKQMYKTYLEEQRKKALKELEKMPRPIDDCETVLARQRTE